MTLPLDSATPAYALPWLASAPLRRPRRLRFPTYTRETGTVPAKLHR